MGIRYTDSAGKHHLTEAEIVWVIMHAIDVRSVDDRHGQDARRFLGPIHGQTDRLAEVIVAQDGPDFVIFHAMETGQRLR